MKAVILNKPGDFSIEKISTPEPQADEVLLRIVMSGICVNDVRDFKGENKHSFPRIGGHEYCGVIEKLGAAVDRKKFSVGQKAVSYIIDDCKTCYLCKRGEENICLNMAQSKTLQNPDGISGYCGFAEFIAVKAEELLLYPDDADFERMAFTEPLACVVNSVNHADIRFGDDVLVIGGGTMGLLHVLLSKKRGARVILSEPMKERRKKALNLGCDITINPLNLPEELNKLTDGRGANVVFNTTAIPAVAKQAVELTAAGGVVNMFSSIHPNTPVEVDMGKIHSLQKTIRGTVNSTVSDFQQAVLLIGKKIIAPSPLIENIFPFEKFGEAMETAVRPDTYKVILQFSSTN